MSFDFSKITKEDVILFVTKVISFCINAVLIGIIVGMVIGGIWLLYKAITAPPTKKRKRSDYSYNIRLANHRASATQLNVLGYNERV